MQQTIYRRTSEAVIVPKTEPSARPLPRISRTLTVRRWAARQWDLVGVLLLMAASAAYGVFALTHLTP